MNKLFSDAVLASTSYFLLRATAGPFAFGSADNTDNPGNGRTENRTYARQRFQQSQDNHTENFQAAS